jgi:hypothetical protein
VKNDRSRRFATAAVAVIEDPFRLAVRTVWHIRAAVARAEAIVRRYVPETTSLVAELTEDRRRAAEDA